jgi:DNA-binding winged helix-turn-helix (wHTH) protein/quercetin dioxygenase-like cupin family protein
MYPGSLTTAYRFADFILNLDRGCLQRNGQDLELRPKAFVILRHLVEHAGKLLSKDELLNVAWPNVSVSDESLAQCMKDIRKLLADEDQKFIKTVPRRGYIFVANVAPVERETEQLETKQSLSPPSRGSGRIKLLMACALLLLVVAGIAAQWWARDQAHGPQRSSVGASNVMLLPRPIVASTKTVLGQPIVYPSGQPEITVSTFVLWPGQMTGWHIHQAPLAIYVLEGTLTIDYGSKGNRRFQAGEAVVEAIDWPHKANNFSDEPVRLLVFNVGVKGQDNLISADQR